MQLELNKSVFDQFPVLITDRLLMRDFKRHDAEELFNIRSNPDVMKYMDVTSHKSIDDSEKMLQGFKEMFSNKKGINWAIFDKYSSIFLGYCGFWRIDENNKRVEIGYALNRNYWGKGFMHEALRKAISFSFIEFNANSIEANVNPDNYNSIRLLEKIGFKREAYFRENYFFNNQFLDSAIYCLLKRDIM